VAILISSLVSIWGLLALILIFLGGIIVIFSYITSLANNDKLSLSLPNLGVLGIIVLRLCLTAPYLPRSPHYIRTIYTLGGGRILLYLTGYLLLTLFAIVKLVQYDKGALTTYSC
jgi:hypothetical protein